MDTLLRNGDHATDQRGLPVSVSGTEELIQRALIRLCVKKGRFPYDTELGSEVWRLAREGSPGLNRAARSYVQEALLPLRELTIENVTADFPQPDTLRLSVELSGGGGRYLLELTEGREE